MTGQTRKEWQVFRLYHEVIALEVKIRRLPNLALATIFAGGCVIGYSIGGLAWILAAMVGAAGAYRIAAAWVDFRINARRRELEEREELIRKQMEAIEAVHQKLVPILTSNCSDTYKTLCTEAMFAPLGVSVQGRSLLPGIALDKSDKSSSAGG